MATTVDSTDRASCDDENIFHYATSEDSQHFKEVQKENYSLHIKGANFFFLPFPYSPSTIPRTQNPHSSRALNLEH